MCDISQRVDGVFHLIVSSGLFCLFWMLISATKTTHSEIYPATEEHLHIIRECDVHYKSI